jgi:hypothetical protein
LKSMVNVFYQALFRGTNDVCEWYQTYYTFPRIEHQVLIRLSEEVKDCEVKKALFSMNAWKAPGPDGFPAGFYQQSWDVIGSDICSFVKDVWSNPQIVEEVNSTDICLIPKVSTPEFVNQFRPISLCNTIYKVVSKVIVNRLKEIVPVIVSP